MVSSISNTDLLCPDFQTSLLVPQFPEVLASLILFLSSGPNVSEGLFTNLSLEPSWRWYFAMTPFETLFLGLIILQFAVLNLFGIMPMNINTVLNGMPGRKKREAFGISQEKKQMASRLLKLLKKLDPDECSFKTICELGAHSCTKGDIPAGINSMLSSLRFSSRKIKVSTASKSEEEISKSLIRTANPKTRSPDSDDSDDNEILHLYEEALTIGDNENIQKNNVTVAACGIRYPRCPLDGDAIMDYVNTIHYLDDLF